MNRIVRAAFAACVGLGVSAWADPITWDGNGDPSAGGNWSNGDNWDVGVPSSADAVTLGSVTAGTRTITQDTADGTTVTSLTLAQDNAGGVNELTLNGDLSITQTRGYVVALSGDATAANVVLNANGHQLRLTTALSNSPVTIGGTVNLTSNNSAVLFSYAAGSNDRFVVSGVVNVNVAGGSARFGREISARNQSAGMTFTVDPDAVVDIQAGRLFVDEYAGPSGGYPSNGSDTFSLVNNGTIDLHAGAALQIGWNHTVSNGTDYDHVFFVNGSGDSFRHGGALEVRAFRDPSAGGIPATTLTNNGIWTVAGAGATVRRMTSVEAAGSPAISIPAFNNANGGILTGQSANDALEFDEEEDFDTRMTMTNLGQIAPGAGTSQAGATSVGTLTLRDIDVAFGATGRLNIDVAGAGQHDKLVLATGQTDPTGAGTLDLSGAGDSLRVTLVNGFVLDGPFRITVAEYGAVILNEAVGFDTLHIDGLTNDLPTYTVGDDTSWSIVYGSTSAELVYVPEPATVSTVVLAAGGLLQRRRRYRADFR